MASDSSSDPQRKNQALKILANPTHYQVCEGCGSIVTASTSTCPNCHGYLFDNQIEKIIKQAKKLSARPARGVSNEDLIG